MSIYIVVHMLEMFPSIFLDTVIYPNDLIIDELLLKAIYYMQK